MALYDRPDDLDDEVLTAARAEARRKIERAEQDEVDPNWTLKRQSGLDLDRPHPAPGAHNIGVVALIEPGVTVYSRTRSRGGTDPLTGELVDPIGGVVVQVVNKLDDDTGEVLHRAFRVRSLYGLREYVLDESDVAVDQVQTTYGKSVVQLIRAMAREVGNKKRKQNLFDSADRQLVADMHYLAGTLGG